MKDWWVYDTEGDGLVDSITKFHCMLFKRYKQNEWVLFLDFNHEEFQQAKEFADSKDANLEIRHLYDFKEWIREPEVGALICQNQFGFDLPAFEKLFGMEYDMFPEHLDGVPIKFYDTLSMSRCLYPDRPLPDGCPSKVKNPLGGRARNIGPHGLEAWGYKLANQKVEISDWRGLPLWKYVDRVWEDVIINSLQLEYLIKESREDAALGIDWKKAIRRNTLADFLMSIQEKQGVKFNEEKAWKLLDIIDEFMKAIEEDVEPKLPEKVLSKSKQPNFPANPFTGGGEISSNGWKYLSKYLGYDVNFDALEFKAPPKTAFKGDGSVSKAGENYCIKFGVEDPEQFADFIRAQRQKDSELEPLPAEQLELAMKDLRDKKTVILKEPMKLGNQQDIKEWLVRDGGWKPTLWRVKDITKDDRKQIRSDADIKELLFKYIDDTKESLYKNFIYKQLNCNFDRTADKEAIYKKIKRRARALPTSPQFKDQRGDLCPNLERLEGEMAKQIVRWLSARNRRSVIKAMDETKETGWLNHPRLKVDGKLPAAYSGLTNTNRRKHSICANVPKPKDSVLFGKQMRELWTVPEGYMQIGIDAANMENIIASWWAWIYGKDNGEYYQVVSKGDPHCYTGDTEILTEDKGWVRFDKLTDEQKVAQWDKNDSSVNFVKPSEIVRMQFKGEMISFKNKNMDLDVTYNHRMPYIDTRSGTVNIKTAKDYSVTNGSTRMLTNGIYNGNLEVDKSLLSLVVACQSDAHIERKGRFCIDLVKQRKQLRLESALQDLGVVYSKRQSKKGGYRYRFKSKAVTEFLTETKNFNNKLIHLTFELKEFLLQEISEWDGWSHKGNSFYSQTKDRWESVSFVCTIAALAGRKHYVCHIPAKSGKHACGEQRRVTYSVHRDKGWRSNLTLVKESYDYQGKVYCVTVPTSLILVRKNGKIVVSGNTTNAQAYSDKANRTVSRDEGKGVTYAVLYGAGAQKIADMLGITKEAGQGVIDAFWDSNLGLKRTKEYLEDFWERSGKKFIKGIDGRKIWTRSKSALLNCALQSTGAIMMDLAGILLHQKLKDSGLLDKGVARTIYYHDEYQLQIPLDLIKFKWFNDSTEAEGYRDGFNCFPTSDMDAQKEMNGIHKGIVKKLKKKDKSDEEIKAVLERHARGFLKGFTQNLDKGITVSANVKEKGGQFGVGYCKVGELVIQSIEEATQTLGSPVKITGEYMLAWDTEGWAGAH